MHHVPLCLPQFEYLTLWNQAICQVPIVVGLYTHIKIPSLSKSPSHQKCSKTDPWDTLVPWVCHSSHCTSSPAICYQNKTFFLNKVEEKVVPDPLFKMHGIQKRKKDCCRAVDHQHERDCKWQKLKTLQVKNESQNYRTHSAESDLEQADLLHLLPVRWINLESYT